MAELKVMVPKKDGTEADLVVSHIPENQINKAGVGPVIYASSKLTTKLQLGEMI